MLTMTTRTKKISEEKYKALVDMVETDYKAARAVMIEEAPSDWAFGYGIYGCKPVERDGVFMIEYTTGDSCD